MSLVAGGPVIPNFGQGSRCEQTNGWWCTDWLHAHWGDTLQPALVQHVELSAIAVGIGFALALVLALAGFRFRLLDAPIGFFADFLYTIPSLALFQLLVPLTGLTVTTVEIALVSYTLLILYRNMIEGLRAVPTDALEAARGMGLTRFQTLVRVELPLAVPAIVAGLRIASVSTISIATVAAFVIPQGLGNPIFIALRQDLFKTEILAAAR
jgi:osmoprotectant transport system permease protein